MIESAVHDDPIEPGAKVGAPFEAIEVEKRIQETVLDDVLRILLVAGQPKGEVVHIGPVTLDQRQEDVHIAVVHPCWIRRRHRAVVNERSTAAGSRRESTRLRGRLDFRTRRSLAL